VAIRAGRCPGLSIGTCRCGEHRGGGPGSSVRVALDEWNLWCDRDDCCAANYDLRAGVFFAGTFHQMHARAPRLQVAMIARLVNMLGLIATDSPFVRNDFDHPRRLAIEERPVSTGQGALRLELPPHGVSVLVLASTRPRQGAGCQRRPRVLL
jgi:hypothetical protein